jgi:hypothetical protein
VSLEIFISKRVHLLLLIHNFSFDYWIYKIAGLFCNIILNFSLLLWSVLRIWTWANLRVILIFINYLTSGLFNLVSFRFIFLFTIFVIILLLLLIFFHLSDMSIIQLHLFFIIIIFNVFLLLVIFTFIIKRISFTNWLIRHFVIHLLRMDIYFFCFVLKIFILCIVVGLVTFLLFWLAIF